MQPSFFARNRYIVFAILLFAIPWVAHSAKLALDSNSNRIEDWLPASFEETKKLEWFASHFGSDDFLLISWEGCTLDDPRQAILAERLRQPVDLDGQQNLVLFRQVVPVAEAIDELMQPPLELTRQQAQSRLSGWLMSDDGETGCVVLLLAKAGFERRHAMIDYVKSCVAELEGVTPEQVHLAGGSLDSVAIDNASNERLIAMTFASFAVCSLLMLVLFRSWLLAAIVFLDAVFCQQLSLALVHTWGAQMDSVLMMLPCLVFVLSVSAGVHLANYYRDAVRESGTDTAPVRAVKDALTPCLLASTTTALGLISLLFSVLTPVRKFGLFAALALLLATMVLFFLLPCQFEHFSPRLLAGRWRPEHSTAERRWNRLLGFVGGQTALILLATGGLLMVSVWGITQIRASARIHNLFPANARILQDYDWLEERIGPMVPVEVVVRIPQSESSESSMLDRLRLVAQVHAAVRQVDGVGTVVSAMNFAPPIPRAHGGGMRQVARRTVFNKKLERSRDALSDMGMFRDSPTEELWRVSARAFAGQDINYDELLGRLSQTVGPVLSKAGGSGIAGVTAVYCGGIPLVQKAQDQMLVDLIISFLGAFGMIAVVMITLMLVASASELRAAAWSTRFKIVVFRIIAGMLSMIPNVLPCVAVLGLLGLANIPLEIGSILTASVALGVAVDDTLHFTNWFRRGLMDNLDRRQAVMFAYARCGTAMMQTSLICGLGLLVFVISPFVPMSRFAWLMFAMLSSALLSDLIVLPAILISPLGRFFQPVERAEPVESAACLPEHAA